MTEIKRDTILLYPAMADKINEVLRIAKDMQLNVAVFETLRTQERQESIMLLNPSATKTKNSNHLLGLAADIYAVDEKGRFIGGVMLDTWPGWSTLGEIGKKIGLTWGGSWGWDRPHFENLFGAKKDVLFDIYHRLGLGAVWNFLDDFRKAKK